MSGLDPELSINAALDAIAEKPSTPADAPPVLDKDTAERLLKLSRLANSPNENEAAVAQEMLDKVAKKFGMTGEEAEIADQHYSQPRAHLRYTLRDTGRAPPGTHAETMLLHLRRLLL